MTTLPRDIPILDLRPQYESLKPEIQAAINRVLERSDFIMGEEVSLFEQEMAAYLNVKHAIGMNSGTDALFIGLRALGIGQGDEVITTPFTFFATAEAISHVGATPVFVDVDARTYNMDVNRLEAAITPRTRAIIPVHLYGQACEMDKIMQTAQKHNLLVLEDCAQSVGARFNGQLTGTIGHAGALSFFPSKNLGAYGDGGMLITNEDAVADTARMLRVHGSRKKYFNEMVGYNSRLDTLQAAILRVKLPHVDTWNAARRRVARVYNRLLESMPGVITPEIPDGHVVHQYTVRITGQPREAMQARLKELGIQTMVYYPVPQDQLPIYRGQHPENPVSDMLAREVLSLPIWPEMSLDTQQRVVDGLKNTVQ
jgi:dTDP-4-amino-4,6-dideoxygalactose transaminase